MTRRNAYARIEQITNSSVWVQTGARRHASGGNGSEPASSELRVATRHIVNLALHSAIYTYVTIIFQYISSKCRAQIETISLNIFMLNV